MQDYDEAIKDCHMTLQLNPYHFGALSGTSLLICFTCLESMTYRCRLEESPSIV